MNSPEPAYADWAAFNEGAAVPADYGLTTVRFHLRAECGGVLIHEFTQGETPCMYCAGDPGAKPGEVADVAEPVLSVVGIP